MMIQTLSRRRLFLKNNILI